MKKNLTFLLPLCFLAFTACSDDYIPYRFETNPLPGTALMMYDDFIPYDYNHDGVDEILIVGYDDIPETQIALISQDGKLVKDGNIERIPVNTANLIDIVKNPSTGDDEYGIPQ